MLKQILSYRPVRFLIMGGVLYLIDVLTTSGVYYLFSAPPWLASAVGFCTSFMIGFAGNRKLVFRPEGEGKFSAHQQMIFYLLLALINLVISTLVVEYFVRHGARIEIIKTFMVVVMAVWNYFLLRRLIFAPKSTSTETF
ncbi:GtrA family protein [Candidatus Saccharibacteria bacterium]|nr:GtrA family protein [Candidatus Saccharibacteria bacterium]